MYEEVYKVENLIAWLETKDPQEVYDYNSCKKCLLAQYLKADVNNFHSIGIDWWDKKGVVHAIPNIKELNDIALGKKKEWTFGGALNRARQLMNRSLK